MRATAIRSRAARVVDRGGGGRAGGRPEAAALFLPEGRAPRRGKPATNAELARVLERDRRRGWSGFYEGETARELARFARTTAACSTKPTCGQRARWDEPLPRTYRDLTLYQTPAPTQGFTVLQMLKLIEPFELRRKEFLGPDHVHLLVQAKQLAYHDRDRWLADPDFADVPIGRLLSMRYVDERRRADRSSARIAVGSRAVVREPQRRHRLCRGRRRRRQCRVADQQPVRHLRRAVVAGRTGIVLQNRGAYFSLDPAHPNRLEPGKMPLHTLIASLGFRNGRLWSVLGCMGADGQPQIQLQAYVAMLDFSCDIQQALEAPRWLSGRFGLGEARDTAPRRRPVRRGDARRARAPRTPARSLGEWNELGRSCPRNRHRSGQRNALGRIGSAQRRRGDRLLIGRGVVRGAVGAVRTISRLLGVGEGRG